MEIPGPAGALEARIDRASPARKITAVLCHPHPQYGGSMHDAVLQTAADVLLANGIDCIRFNFRGVGASGGVYDDGHGEAEDLLAVAAWSTAEFPDQQLWWLGYSFGAAVVWRALAQQQPQQTILIAPPVGMMDFAHLPDTATDDRIDAIAGDRDEFVDAAKLLDWPGVTAHMIDGADHFFSGHHAALAAKLGELVA